VDALNSSASSSSSSAANKNKDQYELDEQEIAALPTLVRDYLLIALEIQNIINIYTLTFSRV
jgi:hypothetical protein